MADLSPCNGGFEDIEYIDLALGTAAVIAAMVTNSGPEYAVAFLTFGQRLLPPDGGRSSRRGPDRPTT